MKIVSLSLVLVCLAAHGSLAQPRWTWQNPLPQGNTLCGIVSLDSVTSIAVGEAGTITLTTNGGDTWTEQDHDSASFLHGVWFTDPNLGIAVGSAILRTTDGGGHWTKQVEGTALRAVSFPDPDHGTAVGYPGEVFHTTDGGVSWRKQTISPRHLVSVSFSDTNNGTIVSEDGLIYRTTDGGTTWLQQLMTNDYLTGVSCTDSLTGTVVGHFGTILRTTDAGAHWMRQWGGTHQTLWGVFFCDARTGTAVGQAGTILRTTTGGGISSADSPGREPEIPAHFSLGQNYPNPFNPATWITYAVPERSAVTLTVFDLLGRKVAILVDDDKATRHLPDSVGGTGGHKRRVLLPLRGGQVS